MRFIGLRHGQSTYNIRQLCNSDPSVDVQLTDLGVQQAKSAADQLKSFSLTEIYCSPIPRTRRTTEIVNQELELAVTIEPRLIDIHTGFEGRPVQEYFDAIAHDPVHAKVNGGESIHEQYQRVCSFLDELKAKGVEDVLLVAHEETMRVFKAWAEGLPPEKVIGVPFENCRPYVFGG